MWTVAMWTAWTTCDGGVAGRWGVQSPWESTRKRLSRVLVPGPAP
uniref:Uncharacterized protein n=1 Tax=Arundo donax TaxID=35708 RepID=A0A0A9B3J4_ARUDO